MYNNTVNNGLHRTDYEDLGQVITATNVAAGATVYSGWYDNVQWVRNIMLLGQQDNTLTFSVGFQRRDASLTATNYDSMLSGVTGYGPSVWLSNPATGNSAIIGYSAKFALKNTSASVSSIANLKAQLMGL